MVWFIMSLWSYVIISYIFYRISARILPGPNTPSYLVGVSLCWPITVIIMLAGIVVGIYQGCKSEITKGNDNEEHRGKTD